MRGLVAGCVLLTLGCGESTRRDHAGGSAGTSTAGAGAPGADAGGAESSGGSEAAGRPSGGGRSGSEQVGNGTLGGRTSGGAAGEVGSPNVSGTGGLGAGGAGAGSGGGGAAGSGGAGAPPVLVDSPFPTNPCRAAVGSWCQDLSTRTTGGGTFIALNHAGDLVLATGSSLGNVAVAKYRTDGTLVWGRAVGTTEHAFVSGIAIDPNDNVFVIGDVRNGSGVGDGPFLAKVSTEGQFLWGHLPIADDLSRAGSVAADMQGCAVLARSSYLEKYSPDGEPLWSTPVDGAALGAVAVDANGDVLVGEVVEDGALEKFAGRTGKSLWRKPFGSGEAYPIGMQLAPGGDVMILSVNADIERGLSRYSADGELVWSQPLERPDFYTADALALDGDGNTFVVGMADDFGETYYDTFLGKYASDGSRVSGAAVGYRVDPGARDLAVSPDGQVFIAGGDSPAGAVFVLQAKP
jgi:hypothetical protein